ncbi:hypothetical protein FQA39_LY18709 [Lamprigera yunnana]|nr:hypothetical protein FQA39_LY18709 [Lamprigera yunnana]
MENEAQEASVPNGSRALYIEIITNQIYYPEYEKAMNRFAVPIGFIFSNPAYQLKGENQETGSTNDI